MAFIAVEKQLEELDTEEARESMHSGVCVSRSGRGSWLSCLAVE